jgi:hypothetical protein
LRRLLLVTCSAGLMVKEKVAFATLGGCWESETATPKEKLPEAVGVPDSTPALLRLSPGGRLPDAAFQP